LGGLKEQLNLSKNAKVPHLGDLGGTNIGGYGGVKKADPHRISLKNYRKSFLESDI
jgi:hypothetical protein